MNEIIEVVENISPEVIIEYVIAIPLVVKGITTKFKITNGVNKELIALVVSIAAFINIVFGDNYFVILIGLFIKLYFGGTGIYNFLPISIKDQDKAVELEKEELTESNVTVLPAPDDENFEAEFGPNSDGTLG